MRKPKSQTRRLFSLDKVAIAECDAVIAQLLKELDIALRANDKLRRKIQDLKQVLTSDYRELPAMPGNRLIRELSRIVELEIRERLRWSDTWDNEVLLSRLTAAWGRRIRVHAEPYEEGAGLSLRGFFYKSETNQDRRFIIYLNNAHPAPVVAATFGHELGHYVYSALVEETANFDSFVEGGLSHHFVNEGELFADCLVALAAYDRRTLKLFASTEFKTRKKEWLPKVRELIRMNESRLRVNFRRDLTRLNRISYFSSMVHFFKLRRALFARAGV